MSSERLEPAAAGFTILTSFITLVADMLNWLSSNLALVSVLTIIGGFAIQIWSSRRNAAKMKADEIIANETLRMAREEHVLKMAILKGEIPDRRNAMFANE